MRLVSSYETTDGKLFMKIEEAIAHQAKIDFYVWYNDREQDNQIYCYDHYAPSEDVVEWLDKHKGYLKDYLEKIGG